QRREHELLANDVSFDHLVGAGEQSRWHVEAERLRGLEIYDKLELGRLLDRQVPRLRTPEDAINIGCGSPPQVDAINSVRYEAAHSGKVSECIDCGQTIPGGQLDE